MFALKACVSNLLSSLPPHPVAKETLDSLLERAVTESEETVASVESRKEQWQYLLREEIYRVAEIGTYAREADEAYYDLLYSRLDVILSVAERQLSEESFVFFALQDLLETQSVASCSHIFSWIEQNKTRLTAGMQPQKGKALTLLRTLNDLLRRLSKTGDTAMLCGRILTFLSTIFPIGERSGVNLRGDYGPQWEGVAFKAEVADETMDVDETSEETKSGDVKMEQDSGTKTVTKSEEDSQKQRSTEQTKKEEFYNTFWSLQLPFSRPPVLASPTLLEQFKSSVNAVMLVFKEATIKERAMMGSKAVAGSLKRKRETTPAPMNESNQKYLFPKFLTSPELLDLEIADTAFRRQFLFQLLIVLHFLLQFTKEEKQAKGAIKNRPLLVDLTLKAEDAEWAQETITKAYEEMRQITPNGRAFADTVQIILDRERNWVKWKNDLCAPFDKDPLSYSFEEETSPLREKMREPMKDYEHNLGSAALTEIWEMGYRDTEDLKRYFNPGDVKGYVSSIEKENARIKLRKQQLEKQAQARARAAAAAKPATPAPAPTTSAPVLESNTPAAPIPQRAPAAASPPLHPSLPAKPGTQAAAPPLSQPSPAPAPSPAPRISTPVPPVAPSLEYTDPIIMKAEETKQRYSWLALRLAREEHLHHFGKIGNGDVVALVQEIEKEKEMLLRGDSQPASTETGNTPDPENARALSNAPDALDASETVKTEAKDVTIAVVPADSQLGNVDANMEDADKPAEQKVVDNAVVDAQ